MRKLFFTLSFTLIASFTFASSSIEKETSIEIVKSEFNEVNLSELSFEYFFDCSSEAHTAGMQAQSLGLDYYAEWFRVFGECVMKEYEEGGPTN